MFCLKCGAKLPDNAAFCFQCGEKLTVNVPAVATPQELTPIQMVGNATITEYLQNAKTLEVNRFTLNSTIQRLQNKIDNLGIPNTFYLPDSQRGAFKKPFKISLAILAALCVPIAIIWTRLDGYKFSDSNFISHTLIMLFTLLAFAPILSLIIAAIVAIKKRIKQKKNYLAEIEIDNFRVEQEKQQILQLREQQNQLAAEAAHIHGLLQELYAVNVVYPKYRELVPIVTMWEYFDSGRCTELAGPNGAYNLFEYESRQDIIISELSDVLSMLAEIRDGQYALYQAIQESNAIAERICYQNERLLAANQSIAANSEVSAYNAKIAAENTGVSAFIDFCRL